MTLILIKIPILEAPPIPPKKLNGIDITNATLQTYAYELGIEKAVSEMSQAEKQQVSLNG